MEIINLDKPKEELFFVCLDDWSEEIKEAGDHRLEWYNHMKSRGLGVKLATDDNGVVGGMIQYVPIEYSFAEGEGLYFIKCIWVHGHKKGRGNFQKKGMGTALLKAAEEDVRSRGAKGMAAWGITLPFWMKASWFRKHGYGRADRKGIQELVWKPFSSDAVPPRWPEEKKKPRAGENPGKITVTAFINGYCSVQNMVAERARKAAAEFGDRVVFRLINTLDRDTFAEWGISDALFIEDRNINTGPPLSYKKIKSRLSKSVRNLSR